ncbi:Alkylhydroperoxidase family enzyme, contains CxxC motif [Streptomyces sp. 3213]|uniref:carboxymuconolactone decarboxylase family protein n=1 Tax=Streptomyces sp. 3213.3 TaxID=1855348 RepID=UPI00089ADB84|nr:carboxymuconolactone decarboxylase family protein [Streptomyces sp. 3213.3]SEE96737.1 Alkylhydroperoxidase family enzyme, contains CxxC motif [Streptomyces sp. 3213] [Streptomyces sp. 3213.3]
MSENGDHEQVENAAAYGETTAENGVRIPPVPYDEWDHDLFSVINPDKKLPEANVLGIFQRHPALARAFLTFNMHLNTTTLPARVRELAIMRVAWRRGSRYEWASHVLIGRKHGVTESEIEEVRTGADTLLNRAVDELDTDSGLSDATYAALTVDLDEHQLMDLVFTIGAYTMLTMALNTFGVELDPVISEENFSFPKREWYSHKREE